MKGDLFKELLNSSVSFHSSPPSVKEAFLKIEFDDFYFAKYIFFCIHMINNDGIYLLINFYEKFD